MKTEDSSNYGFPPRWMVLSWFELGAPEDEYECLIGPLMRMLEKGSSLEEIANYLNQHIPDHFGVSTLAGAQEFAKGIDALA